MPINEATIVPVPAPSPASRKKVLVFPCGSEIGLEIHQALKFSTHLELHGASSVPSNHGRYVYRHYHENLPHVDEAGFLSALNALIDELGIDYVFPAHDSVVLKLALSRQDLHCEVIAPGAETCSICRSKGRTYEHFRGLIAVPEVFDGIKGIDRFPVFLKPDVGQGSKGTFLARSAEEVAFYLRQDPSMLILEYLPGAEFTVDCFTDGSGRLRFAGARERIRTLNGISVDTARVFDAQLEAMAQAINARLDLRGAWFFQAKMRPCGEATLLEIAPRVAGSMGYFRNLGVNLPLLALFDRMGQAVSVQGADHDLQMDRALVSRFRVSCPFRSVYVDLDDTLLLGGRVNTSLVAFLYQCLNEGKRIVLLTKTLSPLEETLDKYRLRHLFDEIVHIETAQEKHHFISAQEAIFIDDSFAERRAVAEALKIPTFDTCAVESLIDWRA